MVGSKRRDNRSKSQQINRVNHHAVEPDFSQKRFQPAPDGHRSAVPDGSEIIDPQAAFYIYSKTVNRRGGGGGGRCRVEIFKFTRWNKCVRSRRSVKIVQNCTPRLSFIIFIVYFSFLHFSPRGCFDTRICISAFPRSLPFFPFLFSFHVTRMFAKKRKEKRDIPILNSDINIMENRKKKGGMKNLAKKRDANFREIDSRSRRTSSSCIKYEKTRCFLFEASFSLIPAFAYIIMQRIYYEPRMEIRHSVV